MMTGSADGARSWHVRCVVMLVGLALGVVAANPVLGHSELRESHPVDGQTMRNAIDTVQLVFWTPFTEPQIDLVGPGNVPVLGETIQVDEVSVRFDMDPLTGEGIYLASYQIRSSDGDASTGEIEFAYNPNPGRPLGIAQVAAILVGVAVLIGVWRAARKRKADSDSQAP